MSKLSEKSFGFITQFDLKKKRVKLLYSIFVLIGIIIVLTAILPVVWLVFVSFFDIQSFTHRATIIPVELSQYNFASWKETWDNLEFVQYYINSGIVVAGSVILAMICNGLIAYSISMLKPKGSGVVFALITASLMIPATTSIVPLYVNIVNIGINGTFIALILAYGANAFWVVLYKNFFDALPISLIEAARLDGCSDFQIFFRIVLPLSNSINMVIAMYAVNAAWSDFLLPYLVLAGTEKKTVMVRLFEFKNANNTNAISVLRACVFAIIPPVILFCIFQKWITEGVALTGVKG